MDTNDKPLDQLLEIMRQLRDPDSGCAWDIKQNFHSIAPFTIEEAYEVADAIERHDLDDLQDELGDLLFQVVFHAQMASELSAFTFDDVAQSIVDKMIRRHPHVFADVVYETEDELKSAWEAIKATERRAKQAKRDQRQHSLTNQAFPVDSVPKQRAQPSSSSCTTAQASALDGVAINLPALKRADKIQKRAARLGFDWPSLDQVWDKLDEEINEVQEAIASGHADAIEDELGDLLFTVVNLARHCSTDSETALARASMKFSERFKRVEIQAAQDGLALNSLGIEQLDALWERAKKP
ncbi:MAG: nucleoside triphosphate pyrophosphohydrolase [Granulosicoccus sp.]